MNARQPIKPGGHGESAGVETVVSKSLKRPAALRSDALREFRELVTSLGGDPNALLRACRIDPATLDRPDAVLPYRSMMKVLELAAVALDCPDFGMRLASAQANQGAIKILGPLGVAMRNAPTLGEALRYCVEYVHVFSPATRICLEKLPGDPRTFMPFEILLPEPAEQHQAVEHALAMTQHAVQAVSSGEARAREVWLTHEPLAPLPSYRMHFNAAVRFGQTMSGLLFEEHDLQLALPGADPQLFEIAASFIENRFIGDVTPLVARVRILVTHLLADGNCTHKHVAAVLGLYPRTLQRRLREEGESFEGIKDRVRRDVALSYLRQPTMPLAKVAEILGYSQTSVLSRSCQRWFAASPRQLRNGLDRAG